ncbi:DUF975 family protein [Wukongibacter baidiensis]|uniref:DUF975 family protein n=1 Tax=Wukongibacter baidiensis TaxID=1723361 RepID=UPI003D7F8979
MWTRSELKTRAKEVLKKSYWKAFLVSLLIAFFSGEGNRSFNFNFGRSDFARFGESSEFGGEILAIASVIIIIMALGGIAFRVFLGYHLEVGGRRYFVRAAQDDENMDNVGYAFKNGRYMNIIKAMLYKGVLVFLWTLLLIIPGIVKSYAYRMVPYILTDNPHIGHKRAVELSNEMTRGQKLDMFILDLSFLGWYILGVLALVIGTLFVLPYDNSTKAQLYLVLRQEALDNGICSYEELMIDRVE